MPKKKIKSLDELKKMRLKKPQAEKLPYKISTKPKQKNDDDQSLPKNNDEELFFSAMRGVAKLEKDGGRQLEITLVPPGLPTLVDENKKGKKHLEDLVKGAIEFELEFSEEYMYGYVRGMDSRIFQKLKNGGYSREAHLDLHGMNSEQALDSLLFFIRESYLQGHRCLLLVTGRGTGSPGGQSVLKRAVLGWLTREPLRRLVLAFATAMTKDGGAGALYVLLRNKKKETGKVRWTRSTIFE